MNHAVTTKLVPVGNSRGIRIPKAVLEQSGFTGAAELEVRGETIVIRPARSRRRGWDTAFAEMARRGDDTLLDAGMPVSEWDTAEWQW